MKNLLLLISFMLTLPVFSQTLNWVKTFGFEVVDKGMDLCVDHNGDVITTGFMEGDVEFEQGDPSSSIFGYGSEDAFVVKHGADGSLKWSKLMGGWSEDVPVRITSDVNGNIISVGRYMGTIDLDPSTGVANETALGSYDMYISKLDQNGNYLWSGSIGGSTVTFAESVATDSQGNIYIAGSFIGTIDADPGPNVFELNNGTFFITKLDSNGSFMWAKEFSSGGNSNIGEITVDKLDNIIIAGRLNGITDFDPGTGNQYLINQGSQDLYVCKLTKDGEFLWVKTIGETSAGGICFAITTDSNSSILFGGQFSGVLDFDPGVNVQPMSSEGGSDAFIVKLDSSGDFEWCTHFGGVDDDRLNSLTTDAFDNVYVTGEFRETMDANPGSSSLFMTSGGARDMFISKFDQYGDFNWSAHITSQYSVLGNGIAIGNEGEVYTTGEFSALARFDPQHLEVTESLFPSFSDVFVMRLDPNDLSVENSIKIIPSELIGTSDLLGRPAEPKPNSLLIYQYSDGTTEKKMILE